MPDGDTSATTDTGDTGDTGGNVGSVVSVRGSVVDVRFTAQLPTVYTLLHAGSDAHVAMEVLAQISHDTVRAAGRLRA
jgi:F-type H+-transporting ATPase subunit beta